MRDYRTCRKYIIEYFRKMDYKEDKITQVKKLLDWYAETYPKAVNRLNEIINKLEKGNAAMPIVGLANIIKKDTINYVRK